MISIYRLLVIGLLLITLTNAGGKCKGKPNLHEINKNLPYVVDSIGILGNL